MLSIKTGHPVNGVDISADGRLILLGGRDKQMQLWDVETQAAVRAFPFSNPVQAVALSPNGELAAGSKIYRGGFIPVWQVQNGTDAPLYQIDDTHHIDLVSCLAFSTDGRFLISGGHEPEVCVWEANSSNLRHKWEGYTPPSAVTFSPNGRYAAAGYGGSGNGRIIIWMLKTGKEKSDINTGKRGGVRCLAFAPDSKHFAAGCRDLTLRFWRMGRKTPLIQTTLGRAPRALVFSGDGSQMFVGLANGMIAVHNVVDGTAVSEWKAHYTTVTSLAISANGTRLISGSEDGTAKVWQVK
ncbi:WD40 repeat domain-containing protein [Candidatus Leptofilum sp.]|uniref:WD40 repeat domain-containing protein n=1 Tax=Candidatus Leptofilum sp. TaxID=3241576 RepID=UPI003B5D04CF